MIIPVTHPIAQTHPIWVCMKSQSVVNSGINLAPFMSSGSRWSVEHYDYREESVMGYIKEYHNGNTGEICNTHIYSSNAKG